MTQESIPRPGGAAGVRLGTRVRILRGVSRGRVGVIDLYQPEYTACYRVGITPAFGVYVARRAFEYANDTR